MFPLAKTSTAERLTMDALELIENFCLAISKLPFKEKVEAINSARQLIHDVSPFKAEPVDFVKWIPSESVYANDYNPNSVAPPEMELLKTSILNDGYTQPVVSFQDSAPDSYEVVDGFHRNRVCKECPEVTSRVHGHLPIVIINDERSDRSDRMASTIRHNRARGKHAVGSMSDIVIDLKRRNWSDQKIGKELGMDPDEVLRLSQISGLAEMFEDRSFSEAWEAADPLAINEEDSLEDGIGDISISDEQVDLDRKSRF